jgi:hypothetical protein
MRRGTRAALAAGALALALALTGCGGSDGDGDGIASAGGDKPGADSTGSTDDAAGLSREEKALKFAQCMREHGVPMDDPDPNGGGIRIGGEGIDRATIETAQEACKQYAPFTDGDRQPPDPQVEENMRKFAQCMRDNGVPNFPDPQSGGGIRIDESIGNDPDFQAAQQKCEKEFLPGAPAGPPGSTR